jgi:hypothetical protein
LVPVTVDPKALSSKLDRVLAMRGDPESGVGAAAWAEALDGIERDAVLRTLIAAVRELLIPEWADRRKKDLRPQQALDAAEAWLATRSPEAAAQAKAAAKACTQARSETFGQDDRVPEAARYAAWATTAAEPAGLFEGLATVEAELLARIALLSEYHRGPECRRALVSIVRRELVPAEPAPTPAADAGPPWGPVPYSPEGHFVLGQTLEHKKFGSVSVTSVGETWIEVGLADGTKKRLAHKP